MENTNIDWVRDQMTKAKVKKLPGDSVLKLMEIWDTMKHTDTSAKETIDVFSKLALGYPLVEEQAPVDGAWVDCQPGQIKVAEIVRVKQEAFTGQQGKRHNGRVCRVVAVRYGDIIVKSIDKREPLLDGTHYSPHDLEKLIPA